MFAFPVQSHYTSLVLCQPYEAPSCYATTSYTHPDFVDYTEYV